MNKTWKIVIIVIISFITYSVLGRFSGTIFSTIERFLSFHIISYFLTYILIGIPIFLGTMLIHKDFDIFRHLGFKANPFIPLAAAILFTLPMFLGGFLYFSFNDQTTFSGLLKLTIFAGLFEELYFRGFLFGQLFRYTKLGFIPSVLFGAVLFASGHLYQSTDLPTLSGIFITTFLGAILFAWVYAEWNYNLWIPVFLHFLMNLSWTLFVGSDNALGGIISNVFRALTICFVIIATVVYKKRKGLTFEVNKKTLLWKSAPPDRVAS